MKNPCAKMKSDVSDFTRKNRVSAVCSVKMLSHGNKGTYRVFVWFSNLELQKQNVEVNVEQLLLFLWYKNQMIWWWINFAIKSKFPKYIYISRVIYFYQGKTFDSKVWKPKQPIGLRFSEESKHFKRSAATAVFRAFLYFAVSFSFITYDLDFCAEFDNNRF